MGGATPSIGPDTALFFDLDGTLTDPRVGLIGSIQYALKALGRPVPDADDLAWCIGPPLHHSLRTLLGDDEFAARALALYRERFAAIGIYECHVYPGVEAVLSALGHSGRRMFVATSKPSVFAERVLDHFRLSAFFERAFGSELDGRLSDKTELLGHALRQAEIAPSQAVMIGDRMHDMVGARKNGIGAIGILYGYGTRQELIDAGAHHICATPQALLDLVAGARQGD